jgi:hypothetical protein
VSSTVGILKNGGFLGEAGINCTRIPKRTQTRGGRIVHPLPRPTELGPVPISKVVSIQVHLLGYLSRKVIKIFVYNHVLRCMHIYLKYYHKSTTTYYTGSSEELAQYQIPELPNLVISSMPLLTSVVLPRSNKLSVPHVVVRIS